MNDIDLIYLTALELAPEDRLSYLAEACGGNHELRARVEQKLALTAAAEAFIPDLPDDEVEEPEPRRGMFKTLEPDRADLADEVIGQKIGRYNILERLGEGGCGVVYVADQTEPVRRHVALKVIKLGMDTKQVVARFEAERQALAMMDHPNIAMVLDAGTTDAGRPFFVMELVRGVCLTDYCDQAKVTTRERLDLFIKVCQAIQHAHQKGIIHRDIKPSNILVALHDGVPVPKVIDFGIAKATEGWLMDNTVYTQLHQFIGTPAYMSPEQAEMSRDESGDIDTRSDIYSLGVLLYELLTGCTPFDTKELMSQGIEAMRKTIREKEPQRPSTRLATLGVKHRTTAAMRRSADTSKLLHQLQGDLDWIVMRAMDKDRTRRYETANALAMDIQRHLNTEPILARPPSRLYEFQKTARRHMVGFAMAAALITMLTAGVVVSTWQAVEAVEARKAEVKQRLVAQDALQKAGEQLRRAEWLVYAGKLILAQTDFENHNGSLSRHYLEECDVKLRGWEHRYLSTRIKAQQSLSGHGGPVTSVALSPDGQRIVTGSEDRTARVWDAATGEEILALTGHKGLVLSVAFSPDGQRILTGGGEWGLGLKPGEAKLWDAATGQWLLDLKGHNYSVWSVAFSPDGRRIVTGSGDREANKGETKVWDAVMGREMLTLAGCTDGVSGVTFSPDGQQILTAGTAARIWDVSSGQEVRTFAGFTGGVGSVAFSPGGERLVTGCRDRTARVWETATGRLLFTLEGHALWVASVAFSPDGKRILTGSGDQTTKVWDSATGKELFTLKGHTGYVRGVAFNPDGRHLVTASDDKTAMVWDAVNGQEVPTFKGHTDFISSIAFSPDGRRLVTGSGDNTAKVWDVGSGQELLTLAGPPTNLWAVACVWSVAFSPDGQRIVTGSNDKTAKLWDASTGRQLLVLPHGHTVSSVAFSPDGRRIITGVGDWSGPAARPGEAKVWDSVTGRELLSLPHARSVWGVTFSPDGQRIATGSADGMARILDATTGRQLFALPHAGMVWSVAFDRSGERIVTGCLDKTVKIWNAATGQELAVLEGHTSSVRSVAFSPDGQRVVTGSDDKTVKLWNTANGLEALTLRGFPQMVWSVAFSPDGQRIATSIAGSYATVKVWSAAPAQ